MEPERFDHLTRHVISVRSRRGMLGILGSTALAIGVGRSQPAEARCRRRRRCGGRCCSSDQSCENQVCVAKCDDSFSCAIGGGVGSPCGAHDFCTCTTTPIGTGVCLSFENLNLCADAPACPPGAPPCPAGTVCGTCACPLQEVADLRCLPLARRKGRRWPRILNQQARACTGAASHAAPR